MCSSTRNNTKMAETPKSTRRSNKPLMERRRRERINHCLNELKNLVLTAQRKDPTRYSKLEKADILEMTVRHVQALHRNDSDTTTSRSSSSSSLGASSPLSGDAATKYSAGFRKCASEVSRFLSSVNGLPPDLHARVLSHLSSATKAEYPTSIKGQVIGEKVDAPASQPSKYLSRQQQQQQQSHSAPTAAAGVSVVEARLASGQLALVVPTWTGVSINGSPPTNATSPEAAGAPSSPESARGSPSMSSSPSSSSSEDHHSYDYSSSSDSLSLTSANRYYSLPSAIASTSSVSSSSSSSVTKSSPYSSTTTVSAGGMQVDLQVAPLDLATSQRHPSSTIKPNPTCTTFSTPSGAAIPMRHRATTVSVESPTPLQQQHAVPFVVQRRGQPVSSCSKGQSKSSTATTQKGYIHHLQKEIRHAPYPAHNHQNPHWRPW